MVRAEAAARLRLRRQLSAHPVTWLDVFTSQPFSGNALAVVGGADGVSDAMMQAFARETGLSETSFLQSAEGADYRHRIWMVRGEIPFAGHPSLGAAVAHVRATGQTSARVVQQTGAGLQPIEVELAGRVARTSMMQAAPEFGPELDADAVLAMVGLTGSDAESARVVSTGVPQLVVVLRDEAALARCRRPDYEALAELIDAHDAVVLYIAAADGERAVARSFFPGGEDPGTGSAVGPLLGELHQRRGTTRIEVDQGGWIGRPSVLRAEMVPEGVRVGGDAVVVMEGMVHLDERPMG